jgi:hypothetical protein
LKPGARRKLLVIVGGVLLGGAVGFGLEIAGSPGQLASTVGGAVTAVCAAADELRETRAEPRDQRIKRLVRGDVYRPGLLMAFYFALAVFVATNIILVPYYVGLGAFIGLTGLYTEGYEIWEPYVNASLNFAGILLVPLIVTPIAKSAAHRIRQRPMLWVMGALTIT